MVGLKVTLNYFDTQMDCGKYFRKDDVFHFKGRIAYRSCSCASSTTDLILSCLQCVASIHAKPGSEFLQKRICPPGSPYASEPSLKSQQLASDSAGEDLRQIVMKSYPYSFYLQKKQSTRQYCNIYYFWGENTRKLKKSLLTSR